MVLVRSTRHRARRARRVAPGTWTVALTPPTPPSILPGAATLPALGARRA